MGKNSRIRSSLIRKRFNLREDKVKKIAIISCAVFITIFVGVIFALNINSDKTVVVANTDIYKEYASNTDNKEDTSNDEQLPVVDVEDDKIKENNEQNSEEENIEKPVTNEINMTILGELMMGGNVTKKNSYVYTSAFKKIFTLTRSSDFTYANFSTNITNLEKIDNAKSKYLVTKEAVSAINGLGIDAVSVASDHMVDFPKDIFKNTLNLLKDNNTYISGIDDSILYLEKNGKKISVISSNNVFIGTKNNYTDYGINVYSSNKMKEDIIKAKQNSDFVIVDIHWGRENTFGVTSEMKKIAYSAIDNGADLIIGSHALGVYPVITYKNKPIIYSTGYIMTDSKNDLAKTSYIFDIKINKENKVETLQMTPTYILNQQEVVPYSEYNKELSEEYNLQMNKWHLENELNSEIIGDKIIITFK